MVELKTSFPKWLAGKHVESWASSSFRKSQLCQVDVSHENSCVALFLEVRWLATVDSSGCVSSSASVVSASIKKEHAFFDLSIGSSLRFVMDNRASWAGRRDGVEGLSAEIFLSSVKLIKLVNNIAFSDASRNIILKNK